MRIWFVVCVCMLDTHCCVDAAAVNHACEAHGCAVCARDGSPYSLSCASIVHQLRHRNSLACVTHRKACCRYGMLAVVVVLAFAPTACLVCEVQVALALATGTLQHRLMARSTTGTPARAL